MLFQDGFAEPRDISRNQQGPSPELSLLALSETNRPQSNPKAELLGLAEGPTGITRKRELESFKRDLEAFETRVAGTEAGRVEFAETLKQIGRLFADVESAPVNRPDRLKLAEQIMSHAAQPYRIDQGKVLTCDLTTLEVRAFERLPSKPTKLIVDVALSNEFVTTDGKKVVLTADDFIADDEARSNPTQNGQRSYASQLFQITAANVHFVDATSDFLGRPMPAGSMYYTQSPRLRGNKFEDSMLIYDTGERVFDRRTNPPSVVAKDPNLGLGDLEKVYNRITGANETGFVIEHVRGADKYGTVKFSTKEELSQVLSQSADKFPLIMRVHTGNDPFSTCPGSWHGINIISYNPQKKEIQFSDQYGTQSDRKTKLETLFRAGQDANKSVEQCVQDLALQRREPFFVRRLPRD